MKKHETLPANLPIHIYVNRINNKLVIKIKDGYKLELKRQHKNKKTTTTTTMEKTKNRENVPSLKVVEVALVQCNLVDNQHK